VISRKTGCTRFSSRIATGLRAGLALPFAQNEVSHIEEDRAEHELTDDRPNPLMLQAFEAALVNSRQLPRSNGITRAAARGASVLPLPCGPSLLATQWGQAVFGLEAVRRSPRRVRQRGSRGREQGRQAGGLRLAAQP
jgi:hypothetical protein